MLFVNKLQTLASHPSSDSLRICKSVTVKTTYAQDIYGNIRAIGALRSAIITDRPEFAADGSWIADE